MTNALLVLFLAPLGGLFVGSVLGWIVGAAAAEIANRWDDFKWDRSHK